MKDDLEALDEFNDRVIRRLTRTPFEELGEAERVYLSVLDLDVQVCNGGFLQYFHNVGDGSLQHAPRALREIEATRERELLVAAIEAVGHEVVSMPHAKRLDLQLDDACHNRLDSLSHDYWTRTDELRKLLFTYVRSHLHEFHPST